MLCVGLAGDRLFGIWLFTYLSLVMSLMASFQLSFVPRDGLDEIWDLPESVSEGFPTYFCLLAYWAIVTAIFQIYEIISFS